MDSFLDYLVFYLVAVIGAIAVFLAMPGRRQLSRIGPMILGAAAIGAMVVYLGRLIGHGYAIFYILAILAVIAGARVVTHRKPVYSAVYFILLVISVAGIALLSGAEFLGAALLIVYAGAILVTYVFVIMLAQQPTPPEYDVQAREPFLAVLAGFVLIAALATVIFQTRAELAAAPDSGGKAAPAVMSAASEVETWGNTEALGLELMTVYPVAFEAAGVLLLVGIIGGISLATRRIESGGAAS